MQISRHWRMKALRYRLEGVRTCNGDVQLCHRSTPRKAETQTVEVAPMLRARVTVGR
jgi:hypothetical protein